MYPWDPAYLNFKIHMFLDLYVTNTLVAPQRSMWESWWYTNVSKLVNTLHMFLDHHIISTPAVPQQSTWLSWWYTCVLTRPYTTYQNKPANNLDQSYHYFKCQFFHKELMKELRGIKLKEEKIETLNDVQNSLEIINSYPWISKTSEELTKMNICWSSSHHLEIVYFLPTLIWVKCCFYEQDGFTPLLSQGLILSQS